MIQYCRFNYTVMLTDGRNHNCIVILNFEVSTTSFNTSFHSLWEVFNSLVDWFLWQVVPDQLKRFLEFGDFSELFEVRDRLSTLHPTRDSPRGLDPANLGATDPFQLFAFVRTAHAMGDATVCMWQCFTHVSSRLSIMLTRQHRSRISYYI